MRWGATPGHREPGATPEDPRQMSSPFGHSSDLPPQPRHRAQAALAVQITAAEANQDKWVRAVAGMKAAGRSCEREEGMLRLATEKLGLLRQSRAVLAADDQGQR